MILIIILPYFENLNSLQGYNLLYARFINNVYILNIVLCTWLKNKLDLSKYFLLYFQYLQPGCTLDKVLTFLLKKVIRF